MKSSHLKKAISLFLSFILLLCMAIPAFAATPKENPVLIITGFSAYPLTDTNTNKVVFPIDKPEIFKAVGEAAPFLLELLGSQRTQADYDKFYTSAIPIVQKMFDPVSCNPDGTVAHTDVKLGYQYPESAADYPEGTPGSWIFQNPLYEELIRTIGPENVYIYGLDWRLDPFTIADEIHSWIQHIKEKSGCDKVSLAGISMGGVMVSTYVAKYGTADLSNITMISSAFTGVGYVGELFKGNMVIDEEGLFNMITESLGTDAISKLLGSVGVLKQVLSLVDTFLEYEQDKLYKDFVLPAFGYNLGMWSFVPNEDLAEAKQYVFGLSDAPLEQKAILNAKIDKYQAVQTNVKSTFEAAKRDGVSLAIISNYNIQMPPVSPDALNTGDKVIETMYTSAGATCAKIGKTLPDSVKDSKYISPDRMIDASTCAFKDETWFIKDMEHVAFTDDQNQSAFYVKLMTAKSQLSVDDDKDYPQFLIYDKETKELSPLINSIPETPIVDTPAIPNTGNVCRLNSQLPLFLTSMAVLAIIAFIYTIHYKKYKKQNTTC